MSRASFYEHAELYDLLFAAEPTVVAFYVAQAVGAAGAVLELGCGSGQILVPVAARGVDVTGLDNAPAMLERAQVAADNAGIALRLLQGDMRSFDLRQQFDLIYVASNSLSHLSDPADLASFFACVAAHLSARGRLVFDVCHPDVRELARLGDERHEHEPVVHSAWGELHVEERSRYDAATQVTHSVWHMHSRQRRAARTFALQLRNFFPCELDLWLRCSGFRLLNRLGDFDGAAFSSASPHQICICERDRDE